MLNLLLAKLGGLAAAALGFLALLLGYRWQKRKRYEAEARAEGLATELQHRQKVEATDAETERVESELEAGLKEAGGLRDYFRDGRLLRRDTDRGAS